MLMITINVVMALVCAILLSALFIAFSNSKITSCIFVGTPLGILIWSAILFKTKVFDYCFYNVQPNWSIISGNQLKYDEIPPDVDKRTLMFNLASIREVGPGIRGKLPWEVPFESIDHQSEIVIGKNEPLQCYTKDNIALQIEWQCILTPLRGCLVNMARKSEDASVAFFRGQFEQFIIGWVKKRDEKDIFAALDDLKTAFINVFDGPKKAHEKEIEYATFTNTPQITSVNRSARYQSAAEGEAIGLRMAGVAKGIIDSFPADKKPDANIILATAAATVGTEVKGTLIIPGISGGESGTLMAAIAKLTEQLNSVKKGKP
ncbi:MAG: hypothetical protein NTZ38_03420 [Candidatus Taylorbacteria bacterium]|nr:hypothetical protein [Candidatus Taylorbacteria bacterium]